MGDYPGLPEWTLNAITQLPGRGRHLTHPEEKAVDRGDRDESGADTSPGASRHQGLAEASANRFSLEPPERARPC